MKIECPECRAVEEPAWVRPARGGLEIQCAKCGVRSVLEAAAFAPAPSAEPLAWASTCPKCGHRQREAEACDRCGLVFARWDPVRAQAPTDEAAEALWAAVEAGWDDERKHGAFADYCAAMGLYGYAAQQYGRARRDEPRRARAVAEIEKLAVRAQASLAASSPADPRFSVKRIRTVMAIVAIVVCAAMIVAVTLRLV